MNLNTFARHGLFEDRAVTELVAQRLRSENAISKARVFPYQLMVAYTMASDAVPYGVREALQDAMEIAIVNVPGIEGVVYVCPDVSGSMTWASVTGHRNESWVDASWGRGTELMRQWGLFKGRNPGARLVCMDIQPNRSTQAVERADILNVGGFSDRVFDIVAAFARGGLSPDHWVGEIEKVRLAKSAA